MLTVLFWNLQRKPLEEAVTCLAREHAADILVLAEAEGINEARLLDQLAAALPQRLYRAAPTPPAARLRLFTNLPYGAVDLLQDSDPRYLFHRVTTPDSVLLLVSIHAPSKVFTATERERTNYFARLSERIREREEETFGPDSSTWRTLLVGDLNADPWEPGVIAATCLNAVLARHLARRGTRLYQGREYPVFFNPMWRHLGDAVEGPPGSCYFTLGQDDDTSWHLYDQALLRPALLDRLPQDGVRLLTSFTQTGRTTPVPLIRRQGVGAGTPHRDYSDHLPVLLHLISPPGDRSGRTRPRRRR